MCFVEELELNLVTDSSLTHHFYGGHWVLEKKGSVPCSKERVGEGETKDGSHFHMLINQQTFRDAQKVLCIRTYLPYPINEIPSPPVIF